MDSMRSQVVNAFCTKIGAERGLRFTEEDRLPKRSVFDLAEEAQKPNYGKHKVTIPLVVQSLLKVVSGQTEHEVLDAELLSLQIAALSFDQTFADLIENIAYAGSDYEYSRDGSSVVGLTAVFNIEYQFLTTDPTKKESL